MARKPPPSSSERAKISMDQGQESKPGARRGGRQKGTPNKKTAYMRTVMAALSAGPKVTPMDLMLAVMRDPHVALDMRVKMALKALPRCIASYVQGNRRLLLGINLCL
jgi:hypothetical protein